MIDAIVGDFSGSVHEGRPGMTPPSGLLDPLNHFTDDTAMTIATAYALAVRRDFGNGAAMRVSPMVLLAASPEQAMSLAKRTAIPSHQHQDGYEVPRQSHWQPASPGGAMTAARYMTGLQPSSLASPTPLCSPVQMAILLPRPWKPSLLL